MSERDHLASPDDFAIPVCCRSGPEILDVIRKHYSQWRARQGATP